MSFVKCKKKNPKVKKCSGIATNLTVLHLKQYSALRLKANTDTNNNATISALRRARDKSYIHVDNNGQAALSNIYTYTYKSMFRVLEQFLFFLKKWGSSIGCEGLVWKVRFSVWQRGLKWQEFTVFCPIGFKNSIKIIMGLKISTESQTQRGWKRWKNYIEMIFSCCG